MADPTVGGATAALATDPRLLQLAPEDNVAVAKTMIPAGQSILIDGASAVCDRTLPTGHKIAIRPIAAGEKITKYGSPIGSATCNIRPGEYVHTHNVKSDYLPTYTYENLAPG